MEVTCMRTKMPWIDRERCDIAERCEDCKAARLCPHGAFLVMRGAEGSGEPCRVGIAFEKCRLCGNCYHAGDLGAGRVV
jgi:dissimilatory sulfite reductase (desulfoviridin) alpha/beta subunit